MAKRVQAAKSVTRTVDKSGETSFGERLAHLRSAAGDTQIELAAELDISQRKVGKTARCT